MVYALRNIVSKYHKIKVIVVRKLWGRFSGRQIDYDSAPLARAGSKIELVCGEPDSDRTDLTRLQLLRLVIAAYSDMADRGLRADVREYVPRAIVTLALTSSRH